MYLSYEDESNNYVEFDDFQVTHTKTNIVQYNEYYPFGLRTSTSWTREDSKNDFLYNAGSELNATSGWYETFYRNYDPATGRFASIDPLAASFPSVSGYHYAGNNPIGFNDPWGAATTPNDNDACLACYSYAPTFDQMMEMDLAQTYADMGMGSTYEALNHSRNFTLASAARAGDLNALRQYVAINGGSLQAVDGYYWGAIEDRDGNLRNF